MTVSQNYPKLPKTEKITQLNDSKGSIQRLGRKNYPALFRVYLALRQLLSSTRWKYLTLIAKTRIETEIPWLVVQRRCVKKIKMLCWSRKPCWYYQNPAGPLRWKRLWRFKLIYFHPTWCFQQLAEIGGGSMLPALVL